MSQQDPNQAKYEVESFNPHYGRLTLGEDARQGLREELDQMIHEDENNDKYQDEESTDKKRS